MIVGGFTTLINYFVYYIPGVSSLHILLRNTIAWFVSVIFSFVANRRCVFHSTASTFRQKLQEFIGFVLSRGFSLIVENTILFAASSAGLNEDFAKIPVSIIVIILNYITGHIVFSGFSAVKQKTAYILKKMTFTIKGKNRH